MSETFCDLATACISWVANLRAGSFDRPALILNALTRTRSVTKAARAAGMSREGAYRLRRREPHGLFAAAWDSAMGANRRGLTRAEIDEGHRRAIAAACRTEGSAPPRRLATQSIS